jgi:PLP dependent protein
LIFDEKTDKLSILISSMISENIQLIRERIKDACLRSGRQLGDVTLIAVSKNFEVSHIREAMAAGMTRFGENKPQELRAKFAEIGNTVTWDLIGHLQTNKVKYAVDTADFIHSIDSLKLAEEVSKQAAKKSKKQNILLEVKTSDEETKFGMADADAVMRTAEYCMSQEHLQLCGLMTMAPFVDDEAVIRTSFRDLYELREKMLSRGFPVKELSMGMTGDFEFAIEEGATLVRIGTAIFGVRNYL